MAEPRVHSAYMKQFATTLRGVARGGAQAVASDPELFAEIDAVGRLGWLPVEINLRMVDAVHAGLDTERAHLFLIENITRQLDTPLYRNFIDGAVRLLGLDPGSLARWIPRAYGLIFRDCGVWTAERRSACAAVVEVHSLPLLLTRHAHWLDSVASGMHALFTLCQIPGEVQLIRGDAAEDMARFELSWKAGV